MPIGEPVMIHGNPKIRNCVVYREVDGILSLATQLHRTLLSFVNCTSIEDAIRRQDHHRDAQARRENLLV